MLFFLEEIHGLRRIHSHTHDGRQKCCDNGQHLDGAELGRRKYSRVDRQQEEADTLGKYSPKTINQRIPAQLPQAAHFVTVPNAKAIDCILVMQLRVI